MNQSWAQGVYVAVVCVCHNVLHVLRSWAAAPLIRRNTPSSAKNKPGALTYAMRYFVREARKEA